MSTEKQWSCLFMLAPMSDNYVDYILGALAKLDSSAVTAATEKLGTLYSGTGYAVMDAVMACFGLATEDGIHMTMEATFEAGEGEANSNTSTDSLPNFDSVSKLYFPVYSRFSLYSLEGEDSKDMTECLTRLAKENSLFYKHTFSRPSLKGSMKQIYDFYQEVMSVLNIAEKKWMLSVTMSVNSPSED